MSSVILPFVKTLRARFSQGTPLAQVVVGPRQVGKTTGVKQFLRSYKGPHHFASADDVISPGREWLALHWQEARRNSALLVIDEIQKIENWSETIKKFWDGQKGESKTIPLLLLGSSSFSIQKGLTESLAGRFELIRVFHWNYYESNQLAKMSLEQYLRFGGYPGSYEFLDDAERWRRYLIDSIIEPVINKDILGSALVKKPALFRQCFEILSSYPAQEISYRKLLGHLQDKGNTDLIKYYIDLYCGAFLFISLTKYSNQAFKAKSSSPKILPMCPAIFETHGRSVSHEKEPQVFESIVGAVLARLPGELFYWRDSNFEVDFIYQYAGRLHAIEVKSGRTRSLGGLSKFCKRYPHSVPIVITKDNYKDFEANPEAFFDL